MARPYSKDPGLAQMRDDTPPGSCPFCLDPVAVSTGNKPFKHCNGPECKTAYQRTYRRDRRRKLYAALGLVAVLAGCEVTPRARMRAVAEGRLITCVNAANDEHECIKDSVRFCRDAGLEASCGVDGLWTKDWRR